MNEAVRSTDGLSGFARLVRAVRVGLTALAWAFANEEAFRLEVLGAAVLLPLGVWLGHDGAERALLCAAIIQVVMVDRISIERHALSGLAKDLGSAAVMVSLFLASVVWGCILIPRFFA